MQGDNTDIAVIGMECIFPKAGNVEQYWKNIVGCVDAITELPTSRFDPVFYNPSVNKVDRLYCKRGGHIDEYAKFNPAKYGIMPNSAKYAEPDHLMTLEVANSVLEQIGYFRNNEKKNGKTGIILGKGNFIGTGTVKLIDAIRTTEHIRIVLKKTVPSISDGEIDKVCMEFQSQCDYASADNAIGLISNLVVSRIANRFDFHGPAYTIDAACASSLVAIDNAVQELLSGRCDTILTGGTQINHDASFWSVFTQLKALSRKQQIRPYDQQADGMLIGEGIGIVALKRLSDAKKNGDRIFAVIKGIGVGSDGKAASPVSPDTIGQTRAIKQAWEKAYLDPEDIGYLEGHGTATQAGDTTELNTLERFFGKVGSNKKRAGLGSVKSMIGHTMPAAGVAGLIKTVMALHTNTLPPTINCEKPNELVDQTRFKLITKPADWKKSGLPLIAGVNAFGFGGINAHVVLEEYKTKNNLSNRSIFSFSNAYTKNEKLLILSANSKDKLVNALEETIFINDDGLYKLIIFNPDTTKIQKAIKIVKRNISWHGKQDIWFSCEGLIEKGGKIAFIFPGIDSSFKPYINDLIPYFNCESPQNIHPENLEETGIAVIEINMMLDRVLKNIGIYPDHVAGHSIGEWSGLLSTGIVSETVLREIIANIDSGFLKVPDVQFIAAGCGIHKAEKHMEGISNISLSHDNCPHQTILCGKKSSIEIIKDRFLNNNIFCQILPFKSGFHSPVFKEFIQPFENTINHIDLKPASTPMWSCTTCEVYPEKISKLRKLLVSHLLEPINFTQITKNLYAQGVRIFIQVGFGSLTNFIDDTLKGKQKLTLKSNVSNRTGMEQISRVVSALHIEGANIDLSKVDITFDKNIQKDNNINIRKHSSNVKGCEIDLKLGAPLIRNITTKLPISSIKQHKYTDNTKNSLADKFNQTLSDISRTQNEVLELFLKKDSELDFITNTNDNAINLDKIHNKPKPFTVEKTFSFDNYRELYDHCLIPQKNGWDEIEDTFPVVAMTMTLQIFIDIAEEYAKDKKVITIENIQALKWINTSTDSRTINCDFLSDNTMRIAIKGCFSADLILSANFPKAPSPSGEKLQNTNPSPVTGKVFYKDGWMFHGPDYQGVHSLETMGDNGIYGTIKVPKGKGSLLDNAGQIFSFWVAINKSKNRIAIPSKIKKIEFFHDHPKIGEIIECTSWIRNVEDNYVSSDIELKKDGRVWSRITGWKDVRFVTDDTFWKVIRNPQKHILSAKFTDNIYIFDNIFYNTISRDNIVYRYLNRNEREQREKFGLRKQGHYLNGRIAAKDAIRMFIRKKYKKEIFPTELTVSNDHLGKPIISGKNIENLLISISHKDNLGIAIIGENKKVGIDIEKIEQRSPGFENLSFHKSELELIPLKDRDVWITKLWAAKEAYSKYLGVGMNNNPKQFTIMSIPDENKIIINDKEIITAVFKEYIIARIE